MRRWIRRWLGVRNTDVEAAPTLPGGLTESGTGDALLWASMAQSGRSESSALGDPLFMGREARLNMEVDEAAVTQVAVTEENARAIVEASQRLRDHHERERASVSPVYNFGGECRWSGDSY